MISKNVQTSTQTVRKLCYYEFMNNHFQRSKEYPFHVSIGAIVINKDKNVYCHYFDKHEIPGFGIFEDFYLLMRETIEPGESIEDCLERGLSEEFGAKASIRHYIGSIVSRFNLTKEGPEVEKTTLYFLCDLISIDETLRKIGDPESGSKIVEVPINDLIIRMTDQGIRLKRQDADESSILERAKPYL